jgi:hypothetical protein
MLNSKRIREVDFARASRDRIILQKLFREWNERNVLVCSSSSSSSKSAGKIEDEDEPEPLFTRGPFRSKRNRPPGSGGRCRAGCGNPE